MTVPRTTALSAAVATLSVLSVLAAALVLPAGMATATTRPAGTTHHGAWAAGHDVRPGDAARLSARVPAAGAARVVVVRNVAGKPTVAVSAVVGPAAAAATITAAAADPAAVAVTLDTRVHLAAVPALAPTGTDPYRFAQWGLDDIKASAAWAQSTGTGQVIAVVDTGVDKTHPDLAGQVLSGTDFITPGGDGSADGYGHGTHVAGIAAAATGNGIGIAGTAPGAHILPVRVLDNNGAGWSSDVAKGIVWASDHGAGVINLSLGQSVADDATTAAVAYAIEAGVVVVAAAGNDHANGDPASFPGAYPGVIGVGAVDPSNAPAVFSTRGTWVDLAAPGVDIASTYPGGQYVYMSGTSMATPFVAGVVALMRSAVPGATVASVSAALAASATDLGAAGVDINTGAGLVNPLAAVCRLSGACGAAPTPTPTPTPTPAPTPSPTPPPTPTPTPTPTPVVQVASHIIWNGISSTHTYGYRQVTTARLLGPNGAGLAGLPLRLCTTTTARVSVCTRVLTNATGYVAWSYTPAGHVSAAVYFDGNTTTGASSTRTVTWWVTPSVALSASGRTIKAVVKPANGATIYLFAWNGRSWILRAHQAPATGVASFTGVRGTAYTVTVGATRATTAAYAPNYVWAR